MTLTNTTDVVPFRVDTDGVARVGGTRVTLDTVVAAFSEGATAAFPSELLSRILCFWPNAA
jgi:hypothetical protein